MAWSVSTLSSGRSYAFDVVCDPVTGDAYTVENGTSRVVKISPAGTVTLVAGGGSGFADGNGASARFASPRGICRDPTGNLYVADQFNHRIRKIDTAGNVSTIAGTGTAGGTDGPALLATFNAPSGVDRDDAGNFYIVEQGAHRVRKLDTTGTVTTIAGNGTSGAAVNNVATSAARFSIPWLCAVTPDGSILYVADQGNGWVRKIDLTANIVTNFASIVGPIGVEINPVDGLVYVGGFDSNKVFQVPLSGAPIVIAGTGVRSYVDNPNGNMATFAGPAGLTFNPQGQLLVADMVNNAVRTLTPPDPIDSAEAVTVADAQSGPARAGPWYVTTLLTGVGGSYPFGVVVDQSTDDAYVAEKAAARIVKITAAGVRTVFAGTGWAGFKDGDPTVAQFNQPAGLCRDTAGNIYVADESNHRIRKIDPSGTVTTVAGTGTQGFVDGAALSAQFNAPWGVAVDSTGAIYVVERFGRRVRKIDTAGNVTLLAGPNTATAGAAGFVNGVGSAARFNNPAMCALSADGSTLYVADESNGAIRAVDVATGTVSTYATMVGPVGVEVNPTDGHLYVAVSGSRVYEVPFQGSVLSIAGTGTQGFVDRTNGEKAQFNQPGGVARRPDGSLVLADSGDARIRVLTVPTLVTDTELGPVADVANDPYIIWPDYGKFTESAQITLMTKTGADTGKGTEATTVTFRGLLAADTATFTELGTFADPDQGPVTIQPTGRVDKGTWTQAAKNPFGPITVNPDELVVVAIASYYGNYPTSGMPSVSGLGLTWTKIQGITATYSGSAYWAVNNTGSTVTGNLVTPTPDNNVTYAWAAVTFTGHLPSNPIRQPVATQTYPITLAAPANALSRSFVAYVGAAVGSPSTSPTPKTGWDKLADSTIANNNTAALYWRPDAFDQNVSVANPSLYSSEIAFEIQSAPFPFTDTDDLGAGVDDQLDPVETWPDTGTVTEDAVVAVAKTSADSGKATEAAVAATPTTSADSGVFDEAAILSDLAMQDGDLGHLAETATTSATTAADDKRKVTDAAVVGVTDTDAATGSDAVVRVGPPLTDRASVDLGGFVEDAALVELVHVVAGVDLGRFVEDAALVELVHVAASADTGRFTDTGSIDGADRYPNASDIAVITDGQVVALLDADTGTFIDDQAGPSLVTNEDRFGADTAVGADWATVGLTSDDIASLTEAVSISWVTIKTGADTAMGADHPVVGAADGDTGAAVDMVSDLFETARTVFDSDSGRLRDRLSLLIRDNPDSNLSLDADEQAVVADDTDAVLVTVTADERASFAEAADAILKDLHLVRDDTGWFSEDQLVAEVHESADAGVVDEAVIVRLITSGTNDPGAVRDQATIVVLVGGALNLATADSGETAGAGHVSAAINADDTGGGTDDVIYLGVPVTEPGETDYGHVIESASRLEISRILKTADTGRITDTSDLGIAQNFIDVTEAGTGTDDAQALDAAVNGGESGTFNDFQSVYDGFNLNTVDTDIATSVERALVVGVRAGIDQAATLAETAVVATGRAVSGVSDRAISADTALTVNVFGADTADTADSANLFEAVRLLVDADQGDFRDRLGVLIITAQGGGMNGVMVDDQGTLTENALVGDAINTDIDNGGLSDGQQLFAGGAGDDNGAVTDAEWLSAAVPGDDSGRLVIEDSHVAEITPPTVPQVDGDIGTGLDSTRPVIAATLDETITSVDTDGIVGPLGTDSIAAVDTALFVGLTGDDIATMIEGDPAAIALLEDDPASLDDQPGPVSTQTDDSGVTVDGEALSAAVAGADSVTGGELADISATVTSDDRAATGDSEALFANTGGGDIAVITDGQDVLAGIREGDAGTPTDGQDLSADGTDADAGSFTESMAVMVDLGGGQAGLITADTGIFTEGQAVSAGLAATDTATGSDDQDPFADVTDAEMLAGVDDQSLFADVSSADAADLTEAAFLITDTGMGSFTGDSGHFTETETVGRWAASVDVTDADTGHITETQSAHRSIDLTDYLDEKPGSVLKVNVVTRQVDMSSYLDDDEYQISHALPLAARDKLDAFVSNTAPPARLGDMLEDADFRYRYLSRWVTPSRRETGWFLVAWRRSPVGPIEWLS